MYRVTDSKTRFFLGCRTGRFGSGCKVCSGCAHCDITSGFCRKVLLLLACYFIFIQRQQLYFVLILHMFRNIGNMYMHLNQYCGIIRNCGGSIVVVFVGSPTHEYTTKTVLERVILVIKT